MGGGAEMTDDFTSPLDVERAMVELNHRIGNAPTIIRDAHNKVRAARAAYKTAYAMAYKTAEGTQAGRKAEADLATRDLADKLDTAEIEFAFLKDTLNGLKTQLRALQSIGSLMRASMFNPHQGGV
jgi:hypothetical protein